MSLQGRRETILFKYSRMGNALRVTSEVVTKPFRTHLARISWRNSEDWVGWPKEDRGMADGRMAQKLNFWLWFRGPDR